ncbi:hypothetical protein GCM10009755_07270 [Brevibacterium samyangense]|uniref:SHOCT domain-containing protein n=2 Tax=Brevibacterium samyangense TaxID=366888 RepID=A0ABP5EL70_9MICO
MWWTWISGALLLIGVIVLVVVLAQVLSGKSGTSGRGAVVPGGSAGPIGPSSTPEGRGPRGNAGAQRAKEILAERYARGELSTEEYHERLRTLDGYGP